MILFIKFRGKIKYFNNITIIYFPLTHIANIKNNLRGLHGTWMDETWPVSCIILIYNEHPIKIIQLTGQVFDESSMETMWLLTSDTDQKGVWRAQNVGKDSFKKV